MKNREYRTLMALALTAALVAGSVRGTTTYVRAEDRKTAVTAEAEGGKDGGETAKTEAQPVKDETVYVKIDGAGNRKTVTVSDQLRNIGDAMKIEDVSGLTDIENVKGEEAFTQSGENLVWDGAEKDICYQGTTEKELPVGIRISYQLDGKTVSAEELEGKSGHLTIHYEYLNTTGDGTEAYTPFVMVTGLILDTDKFSNVTIDHGKIISDGEREVAVGMGIPKLKETLGTDDLDLPDSFTIEADVTEYEATEGITIATNSLFNELDTEEFDSLDDLKGSMKELQNASNQLVDGSGQLKDGLDTLLASSGTLIDGIQTLADGGNTLAGGTGALLNGALQLADGSKTLAMGTGQLSAGASALSGGAAQVAAGAKSASDSVAGQLLPGAQQLNDGVNQMKQQVEEGVGTLSGGVSQLSDGITQAAAGAADLEQGIDSAAAGTAGLQTGLNQASDAAKQLAGGAAGLQGNLTQVKVDNSQIIAGLQQLKAASTDDTEKAQIDALIAGLQQQQTMINQAVDQLAAGAGSISANAAALGNQLGSEGQIGAGAAALGQGLTKLQGSSKQLNQALNQDILNGMGSLQKGVAGMAEQLSEGAGQLASGTGALLEGTKTLNAGLGTLAGGAEQVSGGSAELDSNLKAADAGAKSAAAGAKDLAAGAAELNTGAGALASGIGTLKNGSGELTDGVQQLDDGAHKLNDGIIQFNEEGIEKLVSVFDGDIDGLLDKVNEMLDSSKSYKNFSGIADGMDGEVKFIFIMDK